MASIGFCLLAKRVGERRKSGPGTAEGDRPPCTSAARKGGDTAVPAKRGRLRPRRSSPCAGGPEQAPKLHADARRLAASVSRIGRRARPLAGTIGAHQAMVARRALRGRKGKRIVASLSYS